MLEPNVMGDGILQFVLEVLGDALLAGLLLLFLCAVACVLATPFILIGAARDHAPFWRSLGRRYVAVVLSAGRLGDRLL